MTSAVTQPRCEHAFPMSSAVPASDSPRLSLDSRPSQLSLSSLEWGCSEERVRCLPGVHTLPNRPHTDGVRLGDKPWEARLSPLPRNTHTQQGVRDTAAGKPRSWLAITQRPVTAVARYEVCAQSSQTPISSPDPTLPYLGCPHSREDRVTRLAE